MLPLVNLKDTSSNPKTGGRGFSVGEVHTRWEHTGDYRSVGRSATARAQD